MDMNEINRRFQMLDSKEVEMQNLGIRTMMPKGWKIPTEVKQREKILFLLKSDLCVAAFEIGQTEGREIQEKITGKCQPMYRELK